MTKVPKANQTTVKLSHAKSELGA